MLKLYVDPINMNGYRCVKITAKGPIKPSDFNLPSIRNATITLEGLFKDYIEGIQVVGNFYNTNDSDKFLRVSHYLKNSITHYSPLFINIGNTASLPNIQFATYSEPLNNKPSLIDGRLTGSIILFKDDVFIGEELNGTSGKVYIGPYDFQNNHGNEIGTWEVITNPPSNTLP